MHAETELFKIFNPLKAIYFFSAWFPYTCAHCALQLFKLICICIKKAVQLHQHLQ